MAEPRSLGDTSAAYALAGDTLIGVIRSWVIARQKHLNVSFAADECMLDCPVPCRGGRAG
jgi:hypothetical protein